MPDFYSCSKVEPKATHVPEGRQIKCELKSRSRDIVTFRRRRDCRHAVHEQRPRRVAHQLAERAVQSAVHLVLIQPPTRPIVVMTATNMIPKSTVYSTSAAPSSSDANRFISCTALRADSLSMDCPPHSPTRRGPRAPARRAPIIG